MNPKLLQGFPGWSAKFEGRVPWMYLDIRGIVTTCVGNALFSPDDAAALPWVYKETGTPATDRDIRNEFCLIRDTKTLAQQGYLAAAHYCRLRLTDDAMDDIVRNKMRSNHEHMKKAVWPDMDDWPLDALYATHSMAWACGSAFAIPGAPGRFVTLGKLLKDGKFAEAATECHMNEITPEGKKNGGLVARNVANKLLYRNAGYVVANGMDKDRLYWPKEASDPVFKADDVAEGDVGPGTGTEADGGVSGDSETGPIVHDMNSYFPERNQ